MPGNPGTSARRIQSVDRALGLLRVLASAPEGLTLRDISRRAELQPQTVQGLLRTLEAHSMVVQAGHGTPYRLGPGVQELASAWRAHRDPFAVAREVVRDLAGRVCESALLAELRGGVLASVMTAKANQTLSVGFSAETYGHPHAMATGKLLLAYGSEEEWPRLTKRTSYTITKRGEFRKELEKIRANGYAVSREESVVGVAALAVAVHDEEGRVTAALGVSLPAVRLNPERETILLTELRASSVALEPWG